MTSTFTIPEATPTADDTSLSWPFLPTGLSATVTLFGAEGFDADLVDSAIAQAASTANTDCTDQDTCGFFFDGYTLQVAYTDTSVNWIEAADLLMLCVLEVDEELMDDLWETGKPTLSTMLDAYWAEEAEEDDEDDEDEDEEDEFWTDKTYDYTCTSSNNEVHKLPWNTDWSEPFDLPVPEAATAYGWLNDDANVGLSSGFSDFRYAGDSSPISTGTFTYFSQSEKGYGMPIYDHYEGVRFNENTMTAGYLCRRVGSTNLQIQDCLGADFMLMGAMNNFTLGISAIAAIFMMF